MRTVEIDLNGVSKIYSCGYVGEHNETILSIALPQNIIGEGYVYVISFELISGKVIECEPIRAVTNGRISVLLWQQLTNSRRVGLQVSSYDDLTVTGLIGKTPVAVLQFTDSIAGLPSGSLQPIQSDWNEENELAVSYIKNKPVIASPSSGLTVALTAANITIAADAVWSTLADKYPFEKYIDITVTPEPTLDTDSLYSVNIGTPYQQSKYGLLVESVVFNGNNAVIRIYAITQPNEQLVGNIVCYNVEVN